VDQNGLLVDGLAADAVSVTPFHQFPTGAVLSSSRRHHLLGWARDHGALVIEHDDDAELRYELAPAPALQGADPDHVVYVGTVSRTLAPGLRLGWLVLPGWLAGRAAGLKYLLDSCASSLDQLTLASFLRDGDYDRHLRKMRVIYQRRRDALVRAVGAHLPHLGLDGLTAGLHALLRLPPGTDDTAVTEAAEREGVRVAALSSFGLGGSCRPGLVIGYGRVPAPLLEEAVAALARALRRETLDPVETDPTSYAVPA